MRFARARARALRSTTVTTARSTTTTTTAAWQLRESFFTGVKGGDTEYEDSVYVALEYRPLDSDSNGQSGTRAQFLWTPAVKVNRATNWAASILFCRLRLNQNHEVSGGKEEGTRGGREERSLARSLARSRARSRATAGERAREIGWARAASSRDLTTVTPPVARFGSGACRVEGGAARRRRAPAWPWDRGRPLHARASTFPRRATTRLLPPRRRTALASSGRTLQARSERGPTNAPPPWSRARATTTIITLRSTLAGSW